MGRPPTAVEIDETRRAEMREHRAQFGGVGRGRVSLRVPPAKPPLVHWPADVACKSRRELFFAPPHEHSTARAGRELQAKEICTGCPVLEQCRIAGRTGREHGVWGGETELERARAGFMPNVGTGILQHAARATG